MNEDEFNAFRDAVKAITGNLRTMRDEIDEITNAPQVTPPEALAVYAANCVDSITEEARQITGRAFVMGAWLHALSEPVSKDDEPLYRYLEGYNVYPTFDALLSGVSAFGWPSRSTCYQYLRLYRLFGIEYDMVRIYVDVKTGVSKIDSENSEAALLGVGPEKLEKMVRDKVTRQGEAGRHVIETKPDAEIVIPYLADASAYEFREWLAGEWLAGDAPEDDEDEEDDNDVPADYEIRRLYPGRRVEYTLEAYQASELSVTQVAYYAGYEFPKSALIRVWFEVVE